MDEDRVPQNYLLILRIGRKPLEWVVPKADGIPPSPRINPTMDYFEDLNVIIIHGGRDDHDYRVTYSDMFVLDLVNFVWLKINIYDEVPVERSEHSSCIVGSKLLILGGMNQSMYTKSDIYEVNLGKVYIRKFYIKLY